MQISLRLIESLRKLTGIDYYQDMMPTWMLQTGTMMEITVMEITQACIPQQTLTKRRNLPKNDSPYRKK